MGYLLGIDIGTSGTRSVIIDERGTIMAAAGEEYGIDTPKPDWAEQDPNIWWETTKGTVHRVLNESKIDPKKILGIGFSGQMHGTVFLDRDQKPIRPAIIWADRRTKKQCDEIYARVGRERLGQIAASPVAPGFMAPTLLWVRENEPETFAAIDRVILPADYVRFRLCGRICTDVSGASSTLLFDVRGKWSEELLDALELPHHILPEACQSHQVVGCVTREAAQQTGLPEGTPVVAGGGDQPIAAIGNGVVAPGVLLSTIGTGGQLFTPLDKVVVDPELRTHTFCHAVPGRWFLMGAILSAGLCLRWFRDNFGGSYKELDEEASRVPPGSEGLLFLPYLLGERTPHMDPNARGAFFGLTLRHSRGHLARAIMEGVTFAMRDSLEVMRGLGIRIDRVIASGGGARSPLWRQIQADVYGMELVTAKVTEQAAFGAALVAGVGVGVYETIESACQKTISYENLTRPIKENLRRYEDYYQIFKGLYPKLKDDFESISKSC